VAIIRKIYVPRRRINVRDLGLMFAADAQPREGDLLFNIVLYCSMAICMIITTISTQESHMERTLERFLNFSMDRIIVVFLSFSLFSNLDEYSARFDPFFITLHSSLCDIALAI